METENVCKSKKRLLKIIGSCFLIAAACGLFVLIYNYNYYRSQDYKESEKFLDMIVAASLKISDPNTLTAQDYEKVEELRLRIYHMKTARPLLKLKNLKKLSFMYLAEEVDMGINFDHLANLKNLRELNISPINISYVRPPVSKKRKLYDGLMAIWHKIKAPSPQENQFDLGRLIKLRQLESLSLIYNQSCNYEALNKLPNLKQLNLRGANIPDKELEELRKTLPEINIKFERIGF